MSTSSYDNIVYTATMETMQYDAAVTSFADAGAMLPEASG